MPLLPPPLHLDSDRLARELATLAAFSDAPAPAVTRIVFTEEDKRARAWLKQLCMETGLQIREDAVGNMFARWPGTDPALPAVATGSHIDAIPNSGQYDGTVGVLGALEAIRTLQRSGNQPRHSIELLLFTAEEPTRFGIGCLGSRLLSDSLPPQKADALTDTDGLTLAAARSRAGFSGNLETVALPPNRYKAFVELHIEQGPILEQQRIPIGIVTHIAAPAALRITINGAGGHAGAVLMHLRQDALVAAAELILAVEAAAVRTGSHDAVATTGLCHVFPGAINSLPSTVQLGIDVRDIDGERRDSVLREIAEACSALEAVRNVRTATEVLNADPPAACNLAIIAACERACVDEDLPYLHTISRAYHDSLFMARICPVAMIFIPCRAGISHRPDEYAAPSDIAAGVSVLARTLAELAG